MLIRTFETMIGNAKENFMGRDKTSVTPSDVFASLFTLALVIFVVSFIGKELFNIVIAGAGNAPGLFTTVRPAESIWQILGLYVFVSIMIGS